MIWEILSVRLFEGLAPMCTAQIENPFLSSYANQCWILCLTKERTILQPLFMNDLTPTRREVVVHHHLDLDVTSRNLFQKSLGRNFRKECTPHSGLNNYIRGLSKWSDKKLITTKNYSHTAQLGIPSHSCFRSANKYASSNTFFKNAN